MKWRKAYLKHSKTYQKASELNFRAFMFMCMDACSVAKSQPTLPLSHHVHRSFLIGICWQRHIFLWNLQKSYSFITVISFFLTFPPHFSLCLVVSEWLVTFAGRGSGVEDTCSSGLVEYIYVSCWYIYELLLAVQI